MGMFKFSSSSKNKKKKRYDNDEKNSEFTNETSVRPVKVRTEIDGIRRLKSPQERLQEARKEKALKEKMEDKSILTKLQAPVTRNWLTRTRFFQDMCDSAFTLIDSDGSGEVDEKELYSGLLLIHLKLGTYAGPAACRPLSRERCHLMFEKFDKDKSGYLDRNEFGNVMGVLFGNVLSRVILQYTMTLMLIPFFARLLVDGSVSLCGFIWNYLTHLDEQSTLISQMEVMVVIGYNTSCDLYRTVTPGMMQQGGDAVIGLLGKIPESVWLSLPLTLTSAILGLFLIPRSIMMMDDFFQFLADRKAAKAV